MGAWAASLEGLEAVITTHVTHHSAELYCNGIRFAAVTGAVGKATTKNLNHRVRDRLFNHYLSKTWLKRIEEGLTPISAAYQRLKKYEK
jgi:hypothetical protein